MDGLLILDKPAGCTSHDVVLRVRRALKVRKVGHGGTLDPDATGVLLVAVGQATRFFSFLAGLDKTYEGTIRLGFSTDTYDASGRPTSEETSDFPPIDSLMAAMQRFQGENLQAPPPYSAKKVGGKPGYKLARSNQEFTLKSVLVTVRAFVLRSYAPPLVEFEMTCSSGTYVRSVAHDLGRSLGCGAHLLSLRRTSVGPFTVAVAVPLPRFEAEVREGRGTELLMPLESLLPDIPAVVILPDAVERVRNGSLLLPVHFTPGQGGFPDTQAHAAWKILDLSGNLLALARPDPEFGGLHPFLVIHR